MSALGSVETLRGPQTTEARVSVKRGPHRVTCVFCCRSCGRHFSSEAAWELHRKGSYRTGRYCVEPETVKGKSPATTLVPKSTDGICAISNGHEVHGVTVWQTAAARDAGTRPA